ncbi:translation initiation factor IF-2-like [Cebus imitator]|uniref:translation initiation factor IF-2-like n=1 Tax=Cebus imitator TaxID=2715852 RepID=UPI001896C35C|nr:translation initiation factor IF-2-like [Cebus imitator]
MEPKAQAEEVASSPAASEPDPHFPQPGGASTRTAFVSTGAVAPGRRPVGNTCRSGRRRGPQMHTPARGLGSSRPGPWTPRPRSTVPGPAARPLYQMGEGDAGGCDTYPAAPPPSPAAAAEPATPGTIFRRRLVVGGGYRPPIRHCQPTQPPASRAPARRGPEL